MTALIIYNMPDYKLVKERAEKEIVPIIEQIGYEVVEVAFKKEYDYDTLTFFIWKSGGITLDDCEAVNNALDIPLEENDITNGAPYTLNISSPGLDRAIITNDDYRRNLDLELEAIFLKQVDRKKKISGFLREYDENFVTLESKGKKVKLDRHNIKSLKQLIKFGGHGQKWWQTKVFSKH